MLKLKEKALQNEEPAYAIVGQAMLDEDSVLTSKNEIFYNDEETAVCLFDIASHWDLADLFRTKKALKKIKYGFTVKPEARRQLHDKIGALPDKIRNEAFQHLLRPLSEKPKYAQGNTKNKIIASLEKAPKTIRELSLELELSCSTVKEHLGDLKEEGQVIVIGKNVNSSKGKIKCAFVWSVTPRK
jgi:lambda repressor-like predicted transcriptional regulator